jgi:hypothetical protein
MIAVVVGEWGCNGLARSATTVDRPTLDHELLTDSKVETAGISKRVSLPQDAILGQGYTLIADTLRGIAVKNTPVMPSTENAVSYSLKLVDNYEELKRTLGLDVKASLKYGGGKYSAAFSLYESTKMIQERAYVVVKMSVLVHTKSLSQFSFNDTAQSKLKKPEQFRSTYGDSFVYRLAYGAELDAVLEISKSSNEKSKTMKAAIAGEIGGFKGEADLVQDLKKLTNERNIRVLYAQTGAGVGRETFPRPDATKETSPAKQGGVLILSVDEFIGRVRDFAHEARLEKDNATILWGDVIDYAVVEDRPAWMVDSPRLDIEGFLAHMGKLKTRIDELLNQARVANIADSSLRTHESTTFLEYTSDRIDDIAGRVIATPSFFGEAMKASLAGIVSFHDEDRRPGDKLGHPRSERPNSAEPQPSESDKKGTQKKAELDKKYGKWWDYECPLVEPNIDKTMKCLLGENYTKPYDELVISEINLKELVAKLDFDLKAFKYPEILLPDAITLRNLEAKFIVKGYPPGPPEDIAGHWANEICGKGKIAKYQKLYDLTQEGLNHGNNFFTLVCIGPTKEQK